jgi:anaerobic magnesium-protoporphyrin IX monomethyl ester cyclase
MRITFIEPVAPGLHIYSFMKLPRFGLPLLGALLKERGHDVRIFSESLTEVDWNHVLSSDLVGVSTITPTAMHAYRYAKNVKEAGIPTVMGGPHVTFLADEALDFCDYVVRGEGERTLLELVEYLEGKGSLENILGLSYRADDGHTIHNPPRPMLTSIRDLPWPDMSLVAGAEKVTPFPVLASRGCPYGCEFCSVVLMFGRNVRTAEPTEVVKALKKASPKRIFFYDDNFFISKKRGIELLKEMIRQELSVPFFAQIRADSICKDGKVDRELLRLMWSAGWRLAHLGLESINPAALKEYHKESSVDDMAGGLEALAETGIKTHGMFIFGADSDTRESLAKTTDFALQHGLSSAQFAALTPLPGTPHTAQLEAEGRILTRNWTLYDGFHVVFWPKQMTPYELQEEMMKANKRFYAPWRISPIRPAAPVYRKHRLQGYLISRAWEHVRENRDFLSELRDLSESSAPPMPGCAAVAATVAAWGVGE